MSCEGVIEEKPMTERKRERGSEVNAVSRRGETNEQPAVRRGYNSGPPSTTDLLEEEEEKMRREREGSGGDQEGLPIKHSSFKPQRDGEGRGGWERIVARTLQNGRKGRDGDRQADEAWFCLSVLL